MSDEFSDPFNKEQHGTTKTVTKNVGFAGQQSEDEGSDHVSLSDIGVKFQIGDQQKKNGKIVIYFGDKMSSQDNEDEDIIRESLSDMDPALLFAANHFVEELLVKAQEEARSRMASESEALLRGNTQFVNDVGNSRPSMPVNNPPTSGPNVRERIRNRWRSFYALITSCLMGMED